MILQYLSIVGFVVFGALTILVALIMWDAHTEGDDSTGTLITAFALFAFLTGLSALGL